MRFLSRLKHKLRIRTRYRDAKKKARSIAYIYRTDGFGGLTRYTKEGVGKRVKRSNPVKHTGDVLIISINDPLLDRYRTDHMIEGLESTGMSVGKVLYHELKPEHIKRYNVFIFYRCPWLPGFEAMLKEIRLKNKVSIYAVDDLVIDTKYTDNLPVVEAMIPEDRKIYDDGVNRHNKLMKHCDYAITTTECLADELRKYKNFKDVYIDRNAMSDEMVFYSNEAIKSVDREDDKIIIGYFSGTNTHNEDFQMIAPALIRLIEKYDNVYIKLAGRIDAPEALKGYEERLLFTPYVEWRRLPFELRRCHINLSPLVDTIFNRAKSEIKWAESALVGVPVVASNIGAFREVVKDGVTGILVENTEEAWFQGIVRLIDDKALRKKMGEDSRAYVTENCRTTGNGAIKLREFIEDITPRVVAFGGINISAISGGNLVVKKHMDILRDAGNIVYGVESMDYKEGDQWQEQNYADDKKYDIFRINSHRKSDKVDLKMSFDRFVATFWGSVEMVDRYHLMKPDSKKLYLVQNMEAGFYAEKDPIRRNVLATYRNHRIEPVTISKWCQSWLKSDFERDARYAPNGIDIKRFPFKKRDWSNRKIKVLIEGDSASEYKRVDESFEIANQLDRKRFEVSYLSYNAEPKEWYKVDNVYIKVPYDEVGKIYADHDILIKSSILESFSYPPLEMMATGGAVVLVKNDGNTEYVVDGENAMCYKAGNVDDALIKIQTLINDDIFPRLAHEGKRIAATRDWGVVVKDIEALYE